MHTGAEARGQVAAGDTSRRSAKQAWTAPCTSARQVMPRGSLCHVATYAASAEASVDMTKQARASNLGREAPGLEGLCEGSLVPGQPGMEGTL